MTHKILPLFLLAAGALLAATPSAPQTEKSLPRRLTDSCIAGERDRPTLNHRVFKTATFRMVDRDAGTERDRDGTLYNAYIRGGEETARLPKGVDLKVILGGCETHSNTYEFTLPDKGPAATDSRYWLNRAAQLIDQVRPANTDITVNLSMLSRRLREAARARPTLNADGEYYGDLRKPGPDEPIGETFVARIREDAGRRVISVSYYIAL